jgi:hypothetical protein
MVVTEAMRLYPPAYAIGRQAARATEIAGHAVAPGDILIAPAWVVHRVRRWFEEPLAFRPERWAGDLAQRLPRFAYFPFGGARASASATASPRWKPSCSSPPSRRASGSAWSPASGSHPRPTSR